MIYQKVSEISKYIGLSKNLDKAIEYIQSRKYLQLENGRYEIDGDNLFFMIQEYTTKEASETFFETHNKYADIQMVLKGSEGIGYTFPELLKLEAPYDEEKDFTKYQGNTSVVIPMTPGRFMYILPGEPHMPCLTLEKKEEIKKIVFKVKIEE